MFASRCYNYNVLSMCPLEDFVSFRPGLQYVLKHASGELRSEIHALVAGDMITGC